MDDLWKRTARRCPHCGGVEPTLGSRCPLCDRPYEPLGLIDRIPDLDWPIAQRGGLSLPIVATVALIYASIRWPIVGIAAVGLVVLLILLALVVAEVQRRRS